MKRANLDVLCKSIGTYGRMAGVLSVVLVCLLGQGCDRRQRATEADCLAIVERIVDLELKEMGFRDPTLAEAKKKLVQQRLSPEIADCVGRRLARKSLACVDTSSTVEELSHDCLR